MKALAKFVFRFLVILIVLVLGSVIYLDLKGFPPFLTRFVQDQLRRQGLAAEFNSIRLDVLRGVIAKEAVLKDARAPDSTSARIDEVQIDWNWRRLLRRQNAIDALRIANATISVPTPPDEIGPEVFKASEAFAVLRFSDDGIIHVDQLTGVYAGLRVQMSGLLKPRAASIDRPRRDTGPQQFAFVTKALREMNSLRGAEPPQLDVSFDFNLGSPLESRVSARLTAAQVNYRKIEVERLRVNLEMTDGAVDVREAKLAVGKGELNIQGRYDVVGGGFDLTLDSSLDPNLFLPALPEQITKVIRDFHVLAPPKFSVRYVLSAETGVLPILSGSVEFGALELRSVPFQKIAFRFEQKGDLIRIHDATIAMRGGRLVGQGQFNTLTSDFAYELDSTLDPRKLVPLMFQGPRQIVEPSWFEKPPHIVAKVRGDFVDPDAFAYDATLTAGRCAYRGVPLRSVTAKLKLRQSRLEASEVKLQRDEGNVTGWIFANFNTHRVAFDLAVGGNPTQMAPLLGPKAAELMQSYRFGPRTKGWARGVVDLDVASNSVWSAQIENEKFGYWKLVADRAAADLLVTNNTLSIDNFTADFYGGKLNGRAFFTLTNNAAYKFDFETVRVDVKELLSAMRGGESPASGYMTGAALIRGQGSDLAQLTGNGRLTIDDGVLWEMPLFGIFSRILNDLGPGLGMARATKANANFIIEDESARTEDLTVDAGAFTLNSRGKIGFDGQLDFRVKGQLLKDVPGLNILTWFLKNVFEYKIGGTLGDYTYRPVNLPKELLPHSTRDKATEPAPHAR